MMRKAELGTKVLMLMKVVETSKREGKNGIVKRHEPQRQGMQG